MPDINLVIEGKTDEYMMQALFQYLHLPAPIIRSKRSSSSGGEKEAILTNLQKWNEAAKWDYWVVVIDMDNDATCVTEYRKKLLPIVSDKMIFRIAIKKIEAWILADAPSLAKYLGINVLLIPANPENLADPKDALLRLVRKSKKKMLREDMLPIDGSGAKQGRAYIQRIQEFLFHPEYSWRPEVAEHSADSLKRCLRALRKISPT